MNIVENSIIRELPNLFELDLNGKAIKMKPLNTDIGYYQVRITVTDEFNGKKSFDFFLDVYSVPQLDT